MEADRPKPGGDMRRWRPWVAAVLIILLSGSLWAGIAVLLRLAG
jgi:hypothetical protein